ncbi:MAG: hypothetical protein JOZ04_10105 [Acidimicrobiia bacterium]|nr:hypothetical protein [Acidimicrobiia bacterium]
MRGRTGRLVGVAVALGAAFGAASHPARADTSLGGYELSAQAPALEVVLDSNAVPVPAHPVLDATVPEAASSLEGGLGHGLASLFWPGDLAGHAGSAIKQLGQLCTSMLPVSVPNLPSKCTPVPQALQDNAGALNDPFKAETFFPGGPADDRYTTTPPVPGVTMSSHADANRVESTAGFASLGAPGLGTLGSVTSHSVARVGDNTAVSEATSELFNVALAGGLVTIDHVKSSATASTDAQAATGTGTTVVSGLRIGGIPASVDSTGLRIGSVSAAANQALHALGLQIKLTTPDVATDGAKGSFTSPLLVIGYRDDQNTLEAAATALGQKLTTGGLGKVTGSLQQLALGPQATMTVSLGGAAVAVDASPAFATLSAGGGETLAASQQAVSSFVAGSPSSLSSPTVAGLSFSSPTAAAAPGLRAARVPGRRAGFLDGFAGLGWGMVIAGVAAAAACAYGLYRFALAADVSGAGAPEPLH